MLTKYPSYSFSCLTPYICVFCRNEENKMKSKQFRQDLKKLCKEEVIVVTTGFYGRDHRRLRSITLNVVAATNPSASTVIPYSLCGRDQIFFLQRLSFTTCSVVATTVHLWTQPRTFWTKNFVFLGLFRPNFRGVFKDFFHTLIWFEL